jgi:hypothetical protein
LSAPTLAYAQGWTGNTLTVSTAASDSRNPLPSLMVARDGTAHVVWVRFAATGHVLQTATYDPSSGAWSQPVTLAVLPGAEAFSFDAEIGGDGSLLLIASLFTGGRYPVYAMRLRRTGGVPAVAMLSAGAARPTTHRIVADSHGNATAVWTDDGYVTAVRYCAVTESWDVPLRLSGPNSSWPGLAVDPKGIVTAVWQRNWPVVSPHTPPSSVIQSARYDASAGWTQTTDLSGIGVPFGQPKLAQLPDIAVDDQGSITAVWTRHAGPDEVVQVSRLPAGASAWTLPQDISQLGATDFGPQVAAGPNGHVVVLWRRSESGAAAYRSSRFDPITETWGAPIVVSPGDQPGIVVDGDGTALAIWRRNFSVTYAPIETARSTPTNPAWSAVTRLSSADSACSSPSIGFDGNGEAIAVWAESRAGVSAVQSTQWLTSFPLAPFNLVTTSVEGDEVTLAWDAADAGRAPTGYLLEGGTAPGSTEAVIATGSAAQHHTFDAPEGVFYLRLRAVAGSARSAASNELRLVSGASAPPSTPVNVLAVVDGRRVGVSWTNTFDGGVPTALHLYVTGSVTATIPLAVAESFSAIDVPTGTYMVRLSASNGAGESDAAEPVTLVVPATCSGAPAMLSHLSVAAVGRTLDVTWRPPVSGPAATSYRVSVTGSITGAFETSERSVVRSVPPGTYSITVAAVNICGVGPATPPQIAIVR